MPLGGSEIVALSRVNSAERCCGVLPIGAYLLNYNLCDILPGARRIQFPDRPHVQLQLGGLDQVYKLLLVRRTGDRSRDASASNELGQCNARRSRSMRLGHFIQYCNNSSRSDTF